MSIRYSNFDQNTKEKPVSMALKELPLREKRLFFGRQFLSIATEFRKMDILETTDYLYNRACKNPKNADKIIRASYGFIFATDRNLKRMQYVGNEKFISNAMTDIGMAHLKIRLLDDKSRLIVPMHWAIYPIRKAMARALFAGRLDDAIQAAACLARDDYIFDLKNADLKNIAWAAIILERAIKLLPETSAKEDATMEQMLEQNLSTIKQEIEARKAKGRHSVKDGIMLDFAEGKISKEQAIKRIIDEHYGGQANYNQAIAQYDRPAEDRLIHCLKVNGDIKA